jgi:protein O-mannosyl-transferase
MPRSGVAALLLALAVAVHAPMLGHRFLLDDGVFIYKNPAVTRGAPLSRFLFDRETTSSRSDYNTRIYRPLRNWAFRVIAVVGGIRPLAYGLANLMAYLAATLLVLALLRRLVDDAAAAAWATALWVVLPVHVEPVAYASGLGDLLSLAFELAALVVALPYFADGRRWRVVASTALAAASMLTKEMAVTEPAMLLLVAVALGGDVWRKSRLRWLVAAHALVAIAYVALRTAVVGAIGQDPVTAATVRTGLRDAPWLLAHYLWISLAPLGHSADYRVPPPGALALTLTIVSIVAVAVVSFRWRRTVAVGLAWFALSLLPVLHLVPLWADLADRFALFPTVGLALALAAAIAPLHRRVAVVLAALVVVYAAASVVEARAWRSDSTLWRYAVDRQPDAPLARFNLATVLLREGRVDEAAVQLDALQALGYARADLELKRAYVLARLGRSDDAARALVLAQRLDPGSGVAHALAGQLALAAGDTATAAREHAEARRLAPTHPATGLLGYRLLGVAGDARVDYLGAMQALAFDDADGAARAARDCLRRSPARPQCEAALGEALVLQGPFDGEARALLERCLTTLPEGRDRQRCQEAVWGARR